MIHRNLSRIQKKALDQISQEDNDSTKLKRNTFFSPTVQNKALLQIQTHIKPATLKIISLKIPLQNDN